MSYAVYLEVRRGRLILQLARWLEAERPQAWESAHYARANIEDSMRKLRERRLSDDAEFVARHEAATSRGRRMAITLVIAGAAITALLAVVTMFN